MAWQTVAEGINIWDLKATVADMELPKGTKVRVVMDTPVPWLFDIVGAELVFKPFIPDDLKLIDVYGENGQGIVDMEVDPAWLVATLAFIKAHWLAITIAGIILTAIVTFIVVLIKIAVVTGIPIWVWLVASGALLYLLLRKPVRKAAPVAIRAGKTYVTKKIRGG